MTTSRVQAGDANAMGPISYLIVEFPGSKMTGEGFPILVDLVDRGLIRILDLRFVRRDMDGSMHAIELRDIDRDGQFDVAIFEDSSSGLLDDSDIADARSVIERPRTSRPGPRPRPSRAHRRAGTHPGQGEESGARGHDN